jgi:hypothetical protein
MSVACQRLWFPGYLQEEEEHKPDSCRNPIERNQMGLHLENEVARRIASDHPPTIILNNPVQHSVTCYLTNGNWEVLASMCVFLNLVCSEYAFVNTVYFVQ